MKIASVIPCLNEADYLGPVLESLKLAHITRNLVISNKFGFYHMSKEKGKTAEIARHYNAEYIEGEFGNEAQTRNTFIQLLQNEGYDYVAIVDADEVHDPLELLKLIEAIEKNGSQPAFIRTGNMFTYFKYPTYQIVPQEKLAPVFLLRSDIRFLTIREIARDIPGVFLPTYPLYHFSYARQDAKIKEKLENFEHKDEIVPNWFEEVFLKWHPEMTNIHPTHPSAYGQAVFAPPPANVMALLEKHGSKWVKDSLKVRV